MALRHWIAAAFLTSLCCAACADGGFFPPEATQFKPTIPDQRAFLCYRNGMETMIVESVLDAPAGDYAWVVPVPAKPTKIEASTSGALTTLQTLLSPEIDAQRKPLNKFLLIFAAAAAVLAISAPHRIANQRYRASRLIVEIACAGFCAFSAAILVPRLGEPFPMMGGYAGDTAAAKGDFGGVIEHASGNVGAYRYAVVSSPQGVDDLLGWLKDNKFAVPDAARPAIDGYVKKGWKFFVATLRHDGGQEKPHPIRLVLPTPAPVYPMTLTSAIGGDLRLDLYIVGDGPAEVAGMQCWRISRMSRGAPENVDRTSRIGERADEWLPVGHPELTPSFWDGAVLTRLRGKFAARALDHDLAVGFGHYSADFVALLKTDEAAGDEARVWAVVALCVCVVGLGALAIEIRPSPGPMWVAVGLAVALGIAVGGIKYGRTARIDEAEPRFVGNYGLAPRPPLSVVDRVRQLVEINGGLSPTPAGGAGEDVPGGVVIEKAPTGWRVTQYGPTGSPHTYNFDDRYRLVGVPPR